MNKHANPPAYRTDTVLPLHKDVRSNAWAVDASCPGNPGRMEYRGVDLQTGEQLFHFGPVLGTNNIGEFLAIVHALALMKQRGIIDKTLYTDSYNAIVWVRKRECKTKLIETPETRNTFLLIRRAEIWLQRHPITVPIIKWETRAWGEIPADFGRKNK
ncbi:MAG: ribonuclease H [Prevotella sp.]|nr:ribonuclease H [Prevotella sp.]